MKKKTVKKQEERRINKWHPRCPKCGCYYNWDAAVRKWVRKGEDERYPMEHLKVRCRCGCTWRCETYEQSGGQLQF